MYIFRSYVHVRYALKRFGYLHSTSKKGPKVLPLPCAFPQVGLKLSQKYVNELFEKNWPSAILLEIIRIYSFSVGE